MYWISPSSYQFITEDQTGDSPRKRQPKQYPGCPVRYDWALMNEDVSYLIVNSKETSSWNGSELGIPFENVIGPDVLG